MNATRVATVVLALALVTVTLASADTGRDPNKVLLGWQEGRFTVGFPGADVRGWNAASWPVAVDACHATLLADATFDPDTTTVGAFGTEADLPHRVRVRIDAPAWPAPVETVLTESGFGRVVGTAPAAAADATVTIVHEQGAPTEWRFRLRGWASDLSADACLPDLLLNELELDPPGAAAQWVEIWNREAFDVDASDWVLLTGTGGSQPFPPGTVFPANGFVVVSLTSVTVAPGERLTLLRTDGSKTDSVDGFSDTGDDASTWQRRADAPDAWVFAPGTPFAVNVS